MAYSPKPFKVDVPDSALEDLHTRLSLTRFPDELDEAGLDYGAPLTDIKRLVARWKDGYDWRAAEKEINKLPMFTIPIHVENFDALDIHFVYQKSSVSGAIPLLFVHGWPGHFLEVSKILPLLTNPEDPRQPAFHVVAPSLPNFGFSEGVKKKGFKTGQYAEVCDKLMKALGYQQYVTQGGDWGAHVTRNMAITYGGKSLRAFHTNYAGGREPSKWTQPWLYWSKLSTEEHAGLQRTKWFLEKGLGYFQIQSTKPQTLGYSLVDSPVGLLAWIYEKLLDWTDSYPWTDDEVLTWVSVYCFSRAGPAASVRIYYETVQSGERAVVPDVPRHVPMGVSYFPKEIRQAPSSHIRAAAFVVQESRHEKGGHFAAYEQPQALVNDLRAMFGRKGPAFGVVKNAPGYPLRIKL